MSTHDLLEVPPKISLAIPRKILLHRTDDEKQSIPRAIWVDPIDDVRIEHEILTAKDVFDARYKFARLRPINDIHSSYGLSETLLKRFKRSHGEDPTLVAQGVFDANEDSTREVVLTDWGIDIINPCISQGPKVISKPKYRSPLDSPLHLRDRKVAIPKRFKQTVRFGSWLNKLAVTRPEDIEAAHKTMEDTRVLEKAHSLSHVLRYKRAFVSKMTTHPSRGLSFRGRGVLDVKLGWATQEEIDNFSDKQTDITDAGIPSRKPFLRGSTRTRSLIQQPSASSVFSASSPSKSKQPIRFHSLPTENSESPKIEEDAPIIVPAEKQPSNISSSLVVLADLVGPTSLSSSNDIEEPQSNEIRRVASDIPIAVSDHTIYQSVLKAKEAATEPEEEVDEDDDLWIQEQKKLLFNRPWQQVEEPTPVVTEATEAEPDHSSATYVPQEIQNNFAERLSQKSTAPTSQLEDKSSPVFTPDVNESNPWRQNSINVAQILDLNWSTSVPQLKEPELPRFDDSASKPDQSFPLFNEDIQKSMANVESPQELPQTSVSEPINRGEIVEKFNGDTLNTVESAAYEKDPASSEKDPVLQAELSRPAANIILHVEVPRQVESPASIQSSSAISKNQEIHRISKYEKEPIESSPVSDTKVGSSSSEKKKSRSLGNLFHFKKSKQSLSSAKDDSSMRDSKSDRESHYSTHVDQAPQMDEATSGAFIAEQPHMSEPTSQETHAILKVPQKTVPSHLSTSSVPAVFNDTWASTTEESNRFTQDEQPEIVNLNISQSGLSKTLDADYEWKQETPYWEKQQSTPIALVKAPSEVLVSENRQGLKQSETFSQNLSPEDKNSYWQRSIVHSPTMETVGKSSATASVVASQASLAPYTKSSSVLALASQSQQPSAISETPGSSLKVESTPTTAYGNVHESPKQLASQSEEKAATPKIPVKEKQHYSLLKDVGMKLLRSSKSSLNETPKDDQPSSSKTVKSSALSHVTTSMDSLDDRARHIESEQALDEATTPNTKKVSESIAAFDATKHAVSVEPTAENKFSVSDARLPLHVAIENNNVASAASSKIISRTGSETSIFQHNSSRNPPPPPPTKSHENVVQAKAESVKAISRAPSMKKSSSTVNEAGKGLFTMVPSPAASRATDPEEYLKLELGVDFKGIKCTTKVADFSLYVSEKGKSVKHFFPLELRRVITVKYQAEECSIQACTPRKGNKSGAKLKKIKLAFQTADEAKTWADSLKSLVFGGTHESFLRRQILVLLDKHDKDGSKLYEKYMKEVFEASGRIVIEKTAQYNEFSMANAISGLDFKGIGHIVCFKEDFGPRLQQLLVRNQYAKDPSMCFCERDPVDAALAITRSSIGRSNESAVFVSGLHLKREEGKLASLFSKFKG